VLQLFAGWLGWSRVLSNLQVVVAYAALVLAAYLRIDLSLVR